MLKALTKLEDFRNPLTEPLPNCHDVEQALLGALMVDNNRFMQVSDIVKEGMFGEDVHNELYGAIKMMIESDRPATPMTLKPYVGEADLGNNMTPMAYLAHLAKVSTGTANILGYAKEVQAFAARRAFILMCHSAMHEAWQPNAKVTLPDLLRMHEDKVETLRPKLGGNRKGFRSMALIAHETYEQIEGESNGKIKIRRLKTGFKNLDAKIGGLQEPDLVIIAGRPASGKTALTLDIVINASIQLLEEKSTGQDTSPGVVGFMSLEMGDKQIGERAFSRIAQVSGTRIRRRALENAQLEKLWEAKETTMRLPIEIDDAGGLSVAQICHRARRLHSKKRLRLLAIDYLQLIHGNGSGNGLDQRNREIAVITASLKELAKELKIPIILLSQVGRQVDARENKRPNDSDLKDGGSIEQDADTILFVYRDEAYVRKEQPIEGTEAYMEWEAKLERVRGQAEIIIGKNRFGSQGMVMLGYDGPHTTFMDEPPARAVSPEKIRRENKEREKKGPKLSVDAAVLYETMKGMMNARGRRVTDEERQYELSTKSRELPKNIRVIDRVEVFNMWASERMAGEGETAQRNKFTGLMDKLRDANKTALIGSKERGAFLWLPEMVEG